VKGEKVAELEIRTSEGEPSRVPLFAGASVAKAGTWDRIVNGLVSFLP
jgi:hypothetical protein